MSPVKVTYYCLPLSSRHIAQTLTSETLKSFLLPFVLTSLHLSKAQEAVCSCSCFFTHIQSKVDLLLKISSSARNMYLTTKPFHPSDLLAQERTVNYRIDTLGLGLI